MDMQRRLLLKSMVALGSAPSLGLIGSGMVLSAEPTAAMKSASVMVLVNEGTKQSSFLQGIRAAKEITMLQVHEINPNLDSLRALQHTIQATQKGYVVGLVDDASGTLIVDQARAAGVHVHWLGQHVVNAKQSRHRLSTGSVIAGDALFRDRLIARGFTVHSDKRQTVGGWKLSDEFISYVHDGLPSDQQWAVDLGLMIANADRTASVAIPHADSRLAPLTGHFVSFAFKI